jgi:23S rRNA (guanosine2251-2'-O)-methyltransferase
MPSRKRPNSRSGRTRRRSGGGSSDADASIIIGGPHAVEAALADPSGVYRILVEQAAGGRAGKLGEMAKRLGVGLSVVARGEADRLSGVRAQGVAAEISFSYSDLDDFLTASSGLLVFLDGIEDPHNLGAIVRTCEAAGALAVIIPARRSVSVTSAVVRASAGAVMRMPVCRAGNLVQAMDAARNEGFWLVGLAADASTTIAPVAEDGKTGLIVGSEGSGMRRLVAERCDQVARLPMLGETESLNASVATALAIYRLCEGSLYGRSEC